MGGLKDPEYEALLVLRDTGARQQHGWVTDDCGIALKIVDRLRAAALDVISVGVILRQSGVMTAALVQRMAPDDLWT
ncbi:hypothetical protein, partial [Streptomyces sp. NPDC049585]|uniref:hypothetical protein n=1 Tax=Streptomyces sp. NPDC049585 TaxID=3155154 RepID=UPI00344A34E7